MSLFELLSNFLEPFLELIPRLARRPADNEWMIIDHVWGPPKAGKYPTLYVPSLTHIEYLPAAHLPIDAGLQRATTADSNPVAINATATVKIIDPVKCYLVAGDGYEELAATAIRHVVCEIAMSHNLAHISELWQDDIGFDDISVSLDEYGIELQIFRVEDLQSVIPLSLLTS